MEDKRKAHEELGVSVVKNIKNNNFKALLT